MSNIATPEMIAAAWDAWKSRPGWKLGPGPAFREAIEAALSVRSKEPELEHHVLADLAARLAKAERALEEAKTMIAGAFADEARRAVAQAIADDMARQDYADAATLPDDLSWPWIDQGHTDFGSLADAALRAARKWMESRHD